MRHEDYARALKQLPFVEPSAERVGTVLPHKTPEQVERLLQLWYADFEEKYIVAPPLRVKGAAHILHFHHGNAYRRVKPRLRWYASIRLEQMGFFPCATEQGVREVVEYAERNWGDKLVADTWHKYSFVTVGETDYFYTTGKRRGVKEVSTNRFIAAELKGERDHTPIIVPLEKIVQKADHA